ncbi:hypothetical protein VTK73DRAFT_2968 [Phialemonium thermophilum]|uniref:Uncharacterized protein n=1 Tax=Phialemonium thermophilum TaxID=223376 RepID=A0ABR3VML5_9PEZI
MAGRECTDLLAMGLFALFLSVVVVVEAWAAIFYSARKLFSRRGAIHLEENQPNGPLSVRSDASYASCPATEEKRGI